MTAHTAAPVAPRTYLVGCDSKNDTRVFSGSTYHLARQGVQDGVLTAMVNLYPRGIGGWGTYARAGWWKLRGGIYGRHGFIFTDEFLDGVWRRRLPELRGSVVINNFQLFGSHFLRSHRGFGITPYVYIDGTLGEYFGNYRGFDTPRFDEDAMNQALATERDGYEACCKVVAMSKRSAADLVRHYNVPLDKIHVVPPAANIPERLLEGLEHEQRSPDRLPTDKSLVVGFIGIYPERKGLPTIAGAVQLLRQTGYAVSLHVIGKCPAEIARQDGVTYFGLIDKRLDIERFIEIVRGVDIGCMLSHAELTGIALLEFLRMGVPVIATDVGGVPDIIDLGAGVLVSPEVSPHELAQLLARMIDEPDRLRALRETAWRRQHNASWRRVVRELKEVLS
jgi:glycosyltransferase involved in cell wall biosynthesis